MEATHGVFDTAVRLSRRFAGPGGYGIAYGSHAAGISSRQSDLDLVVISVEPLGVVEIDELVAGVTVLHHEHGLLLDTEVDHIKKIHATVRDVDSATSLRCFPLQANGEVDLPAVVPQSWFLNSDTFRLRLLLNALTTPHVFLDGDIGRFDQDRRAAERAVALLAMAASRSVSPSTRVLMRVLCVRSDGSAGEDFLGYTPGPHLYSVLRRGLARLRDENLVTTIDGDRYEYDPTSIRTAIAQSRDQAWRRGLMQG